MSKKQENALKPCQILTMFPEFKTRTEAQKSAFRKTAYYQQRISTAEISIEEIKRFSIAEIWELTHASFSSIHRWRNGTVTMPYATQQLLKYCMYGIIPQGFGTWGGSRFGKDGKIYPLDSAVGYTAQELHTFYMIEAKAGLVPGLENQIRELKTQLDFHKHQTKTNATMGFMRGLVEVIKE